MNPDDFEALLAGAKLGLPANPAKPTPPAEQPPPGALLQGKPMPELGGKRFATAFGGRMEEMRKRIETATRLGSVAIEEAAKRLETSIEQGSADVARAINQEADAVDRSFGEMLGNSPPADEEEAPKVEGSS